MVPKHLDTHPMIHAKSSSRTSAYFAVPAATVVTETMAERGWRWNPSCRAASNPWRGSLGRGSAAGLHHYNGNGVARRTTTSTTALFESAASSTMPPSSLTPDQPHGGNSFIHSVQSVGPTLLLGIATAVLYRSVLRHPNSKLTSQSVTYMLLLALQVAIQPKLSQWTVLRSDDKVTVALMEEVVKTTVAGMLWWLQGIGARMRSLSSWSLSSSLLVAGLPAALYAAQGVLTYTGLQRLDAVTFNGLSQLKTVSAAIFCYFILGTTQSPQQMVAIALLLASSLLFQRQPSPQQEPATTSKTIEPVKASSRTLPNGSFPQLKLDALTGVSACLMATAISGLAGALSQRGVQRAIHHGADVGRDPFFYCGEVSLYSALCLLTTSLVKRFHRGEVRRQSAAAANELKVSSSSRPVAPPSIRSVRWSLWIPVTVKAMGGIVTVLVHKHAGSVPKGFALVLGLVLSGMLEPDSLSLPKLAGTALVLLSSWMHFTST